MSLFPHQHTGSPKRFKTQAVLTEKFILLVVLGSQAKGTGGTPDTHLHAFFRSNVNTRVLQSQVRLPFTKGNQAPGAMCYPSSMERDQPFYKGCGNLCWQLLAATPAKILIEVSLQLSRKKEVFHICLLILLDAFTTTENWIFLI